MKKKYLLLLTSLFIISCNQNTNNYSSDDNQSNEISSSYESSLNLQSEISQELSSDTKELESETVSEIINKIIDGKDNIWLVEHEKIDDIHTQNQKAYLKGSYETIEKYADGWTECSKPENVILCWDFFEDGLPDSCNGNFERFDVFVDTNEDFQNSKIYSLSKDNIDEFKIEINNLYLGMTYFWKVQAIFKDVIVESQTSSFKTNNVAPRNLDIDGVSNVRDLGGWEIDDNHIISQGMIYRGAAFDDKLYETHITEKGIDQARNELNIKTEIELRWISIGEIESKQESLLGNDINYYENEFNYNDDKLLEGNYESIAKCFKIFADKSQYPIYYHCRIGTDRTGILTFLLFGLLGLPKDIILKDYLFSNFGYVGGNRKVSNIQKAYIDKIETFEGDTLQDKITNLLKTKCNLDDKTLNDIKSIMIEEIVI